MPVRTRPVALAAAALVALTALAACDFESNEYVVESSEPATITEVRVDGGAGSVSVQRGTGAEVQIRREVRYQGDRVDDKTYSITGGVLTLDTRCGNRCSVSYEVRVPAPVRVTGRIGSGNLDLADVADVDVEAHSGNVLLTRVSGTVRARATSGNVTATDCTGRLRLEASSGNITADGVRADITAIASSGEVDVTLAEPANVHAEATSGNVTVRVPPAGYRVTTDVGAGDERVRIPADPSGRYLLDLRVRSGNLTVEDA